VLQRSDLLYKTGYRGEDCFEGRIMAQHALDYRGRSIDAFSLTPSLFRFTGVFFKCARIGS
jgi:hypothetical protein